MLDYAEMGKRRSNLGCYGADGGTRTRTSRGKQILSLLRLPVSPRPHPRGIVESAAPVKRKANRNIVAGYETFNR